MSGAIGSLAIGIGAIGAAAPAAPAITQSPTAGQSGELAHQFGYDLETTASGDLALSSGTEEGQERVLRRLLTNPGDYLWDLPYGAGLASFIGQPTSAAQIAAISRAQMFLENAVARSPSPQITVLVQPDGTVTETISYVDSTSGQTQMLTVPVAA